ncbi:hypothetical protein TNCV_2888681 [Trichonephila clavipes]|nr:hypothetical protein TNCV_2888681 [Trichonephila clavipes]
MDASLAIGQLKETTENCSEITDNKSTNNYKTVEFQTTTEGRIKSDISILDNQQNTDAFSNGMEDASSLKKFSPFILRNNISEPLEHSSQSSSETPLVQGTKYLFYDDNGKKFIIDNADFEVEEKELIDIFNSNSTTLHNNTNIELFENRSYNEDCHFYPIPMNVSSEDEDVEGNTVNSSQKKNILRKMKSFFKNVRNAKAWTICNDISSEGLDYNQTLQCQAKACNICNDISSKGLDYNQTLQCQAKAWTICIDISSKGLDYLY